MTTIYHLVLRRIWERDSDQPYRADSLASEGFIHCSFADQVAHSANRFYADAQNLLVLHIDPARLTRPLREEASGSGEWFPHIYGPINRDAVVTAQALTRGADGRWQFSCS
jgi:glutathione S-transferase